MTHTTVYVDFDGVFNAYNHMPPTARSGWGEGWTKRVVGGYSILWSHQLVSFFRELDARDDVTIKVLSTWTSDWTTMLAPELGVGLHWPIVGADVSEADYEDFASWWKLEALQKDIAGNPRPDRVVWIDDDLRHERKAAMTFSNYSFETLAVAPLFEVGLTREHTEGILEFINNGR